MKYIAVRQLQRSRKMNSTTHTHERLRSLSFRYDIRISRNEPHDTHWHIGRWRSTYSSPICLCMRVLVCTHRERVSEWASDRTANRREREMLCWIQCYSCWKWTERKKWDSNRQRAADDNSRSSNNNVTYQEIFVKERDRRVRAACKYVCIDVCV